MTPAARSAPLPGLAERMQAFRSLGGNCEFGFVQRYCGVEPSGLLRFAYTPLDALIRALARDFEGYGAPGDLRVEETESGAYYGRSLRYDIWWNTMQIVGSADPAALLEREYGRVAHLRRRMLDELAAGAQILVRTASQGETEADFARLAAALARHGPSPLLCVTAAGPDWTPEPVLRIREHLFAGRVRRFATDQAWLVDLEPWIALCDGAYAARAGLPADAFAPEPAPDPLHLPRLPRLHRARGPEPGLTAFTRAVDPAAFDPSEPYVFSAWVWIPAACGAERIFANVGQQRLGWSDADLALRERWQRVWAAGRFGSGPERAPVGLGMIGRGGDRFWSCRPAFHRGVVPRAAAPPPVRPEPAPARWLTRWRA